jgi:hypothetical protein
MCTYAVKQKAGYAMACTLQASLFFFYFFAVTGDGTQGLMHARQVLEPHSQPLVLF